jgi:hypothetical protein
MTVSHPDEVAFEALCFWLLERYGGDPRFRSLGPAPRRRGAGLLFATDDFSRIEISLPPGGTEIFVGYVTTDRTRFDQLELEITRGGESLATHVEACLEQVGLRDQPPVETRRDDESWFAVRVVPGAEGLSTPEGRDRVRLLIEGFHTAFPKRLAESASKRAAGGERESSVGGGTIA